MPRAGLDFYVPPECAKAGPRYHIYLSVSGYHGQWRPHADFRLEHVVNRMQRVGVSTLSSNA